MSKSKSIDLSTSTAMDEDLHVVVEVRVKENSHGLVFGSTVRERVHQATHWKITKKKRNLILYERNREIARYQSGQWFNVWIRETVSNDA